MQRKRYPVCLQLFWILPLFTLSKAFLQQLYLHLSFTTTALFMFFSKQVGGKVTSIEPGMIQNETNPKHETSYFRPSSRKSAGPKAIKSAWETTSSSTSAAATRRCADSASRGTSSAAAAAGRATTVSSSAHSSEAAFMWERVSKGPAGGTAAAVLKTSSSRRKR